MRQRTAVVVALGLTTFMLVIVAAVIGRLAVAPPAGGAVEDTPLATVEPTARVLTEQREAEYQQALQTANAQLEQANRQLEEAYRRLTAQPAAVASATAGSAVAAAPFAVSPEQAVVLAQAVVPGAVAIGAPEIVDFDGAAAYAVVFERGMVYIDANSGRIVHNETAASPPPDSSSSETNGAPPPASAPDSPPTPARITAGQAAAAARAYVGGGTVMRVRLEEEHGQLVYDVRFTDNSRVYVDPVSGRVIYARLEERDGKDDEDKRGKDD